MNARVDDVTFRTDDGARLVGDVYQPDAASRGGVVLAHGFSATRRLEAVVQHAQALTDAGFTVLAYDGRGHGTSEGQCTLGHLEVHDVAAAVALLREQVPRVATVGASMGAFAVLSHAVGDAQLAGVVLISIATTWRSVMTARGAATAWLTRTRVGRAYTQRLTGTRIAPDWQRGEMPTAQVGQLRIPVAIVHGRRDGMIRSTAAKEVYRAASEPRRLELVDGMGHAFQKEGVEAVTRSVEWVFDDAMHPSPQAPDPPTPHR